MNDERWITQIDRASPRATRREVVIGGALVAAAIAGEALQPRTPLSLLGNAKLADLVPKAFAGWHFETSSGFVLPPKDQLRDQIYSQLLTRVYSRPDGASVMCLMAYSGAENGTIQIHRPEICYPASGYRLTKIQEHRIPLSSGADLPSRYIVAESDLSREQLIYWTRLGNHFPTRWSQQKTAVIAENFEGIIPDGLLVRVSTTMPGDQRAMFDGFVRSLYAAVGQKMRQVLIGSTMAAAVPAR